MEIPLAIFKVVHFDTNGYGTLSYKDYKNYRTEEIEDFIDHIGRLSKEVCPFNLLELGKKANTVRNFC